MARAANSREGQTFDFYFLIYISFTVSHPEGVCRQKEKQKKPVSAPAVGDPRPIAKHWGIDRISLN
jgi:hypothetical protein